MRLSEAPEPAQAAIREAIPEFLRSITEDLISCANRLDTTLNDELPDSVTADDLSLWLLKELREGIDTLTAWRIAVSRRRGLTTARIAEDLGYLTGGNLRRRFPEAADIEAAYARGEKEVEIDGRWLELDQL